jgi:hypothetical protein
VFDALDVRMLKMLWMIDGENRENFSVLYRHFDSIMDNASRMDSMPTYELGI